MSESRKAKLTALSKPKHLIRASQEPFLELILLVTEIVGLGLIGHATNCLMVTLNTLGVEKKETEKLAPGWGFAHLFLGVMMVILGLTAFLTNAMGDAAVSGYAGIALTYFGFFWILLGTVLIRALDLRTVAHISVPYAVTDLWFIAGSIKLGLTSLTILFVVLIPVFILLWPATHGRGSLLKVNAYLLIIDAALGFYLAFGFIFPTYPLL